MFYSINGTKINNSNLIRTFKKAVNRAGIEDFKFHDLRHTFATRLSQRGVDIYKVSRYWGMKTSK